METFYHPKTGSDIAPSKEYIKILSSTAQEVRTILNVDSRFQIMPDTVKTLHDLLFKVILNKKIEINQILDMRHSTSSSDLRPKTFEAMWTIAFALGVVPGYENITLFSGKVETGLTKIDRRRMLTYLMEQPIQTSNKSGASDISFSIGEVEDVQVECIPEQKIEKPQQRNFAFCSVKYFQNDDRKSVDKYDITNIISAALAGKYAENEFRVLILANNKLAVKSKISNALRRYITFIVRNDDARQGILGRDDLEAAFTRLRDQVGDNVNEEFIQKTFFGEKGPNQFLSLRFHQELIVRKTLQIMKDESRSSVLWGVIARGGKTYIAGGLIRDVKPKNVFIIAGAYTETHTQFLDDLLDVKKRGFQDFADYEVIDVKKDTKWSPLRDSSKRYIFFISAELLKMTENTENSRTVMRQVLSGDPDLVPDLVFFDEIHKGGTTILADEALAKISKSAFKVFMTATYIKPFIKSEYKFDEGNLIKWGYNDILKAKSMDTPDTIKYFEEQYGQDICQSVIQHQEERGISTADIAAQYQKFPEIQFLTTTFSNNFKENMREQNIIDPKSGFSMSSLFHIGKDCMKITFKKRWECFSSPSTVGLFLNYMGPANTQMDKLPNGSPVMTINTPNEHMTDRIGRTSQRRGDRLKNLEKEFKPHSQLWFLPGATGDKTNDSPLISMMTCLASLIIKHPWFYKNFCIVCVSSGFGNRHEDFIYDDEKGFVKFTNGGDDTKKTVIDAENIARDQGRGLIILAGRMLTLGVSLPCVNVVGLLDDSESSDLTFQKMFRAMTESEGKTIGYVVDMNPLRTIKTLYDYTSFENTSSSESKEPVTATTLANLYLFDEDQMFAVGEDGKRLTAKEIYDELEVYLKNSRKIYKTIMAEASDAIKPDDFLEEFALLKEALNRSKPEALSIVQNLTGLDLPSGIERIVDKPEELPAPKPNSKKLDKEENERKQSLREMILTCMTLLAFLTTDTELKDAFEKYKTNTDRLQDIIYNTIVDRGLVGKDVDKEKILNVLVSAMNKVIPKLNVPYNKMISKLSESSGDQKEVVQFIEENLMPKKDQVASRGEVFTPLEFVENMLNQLPDEVWKNPDYKWLDPANGIGNFPVVAFAKLDIGLTEWEPDQDKRRKHIVENMLYMCEIDSTNIELSKKLLRKMCGSNDCKLNLIQGDFLKATDEVLMEKFKVNRFNICMGNPPYNSNGVSHGGGAFWVYFVKRCFEIIIPSGYITFVHPPGWRKFYDPLERDNQGKIWYSIQEKNWNLNYINVSDQSPKHFPIVDSYVIQASTSTGTTRYDSRFMNIVSKGNISLTDYSFIPNMINDVTMSILKKIFNIEGHPIKIIYNQSFKPTAEDVDTTGTPHYHFTPKTGIKVIKYKTYTTVPDYINQKKVLMTHNASYKKGSLLAFYSSEPMGTTNNSMYMIASSDEEGELLVNFFNSGIITFLMTITQYSPSPSHKNEFKILNQIKMPESMDAYQLTSEELDLINRIVSQSVEKIKSNRTTTPRKKIGGAKTVRKVLIEE